jgi:hypothetical protein
MLRAAYYAPYAIQHNWTPEQVDRIPADILPYLLPVEGVLRQYMDEQAEMKAKAKYG